MAPYKPMVSVGDLPVGLGGCQLQGRPDDTGMIQLTLWHGVNPPHNRNVLQELVDRFKREHPDIQVKLSSLCGATTGGEGISRASGDWAIASSP